jgi:hypothetical protein
VPLKTANVAHIEIATWEELPTLSPSALEIMKLLDMLFSERCLKAFFDTIVGHAALDPRSSYEPDLTDRNDAFLKLVLLSGRMLFSEMA